MASRAHGKRRLQIKEAQLGPKWADFPLNEKRQILCEWEINGGVVGGRRWTLGALAAELGWSEPLFQKERRQYATKAREKFSNTAAARDQICTMLDNVAAQIRNDRARAVLHADFLEGELTKTFDRLAVVERRVPKNAREDSAFRLEASRLRMHLRSISLQRIESLRTLFESTDAATRFLCLFSANGRGDGKKGGSLSDLVNGGDEPTTGDALTPETALRLLEAQQGQILPSQVTVMPQGTRNPSAGFDELGTDEPCD